MDARDGGGLLNFMSDMSKSLGSDYFMHFGSSHKPLKGWTQNHQLKNLIRFENIIDIVFFPVNDLLSISGVKTLQS